MSRLFAAASSQHIDFGTLDILDGATSFTISALVNPTNFSQENKIVGIWGGLTAQRSVLFSNLNSGFLRLGVGVNGSNVSVFDTNNNALSAGTWYNVVATWLQPATVTMYVAGVSAGVTTVLNNNVTAIQNAGTTLRLSADADGNYASHMLAEIGIWKNRVLGAAEANSLHKGFSPLFYKKDLVFYAPLIGRNSPETQPITSPTGAVTGATQAEHPRIIYPSNAQIMRFAADANGAAGGYRALLGLGI